jgi:hypothetical protein
MTMNAYELTFEEGWFGVAFFYLAGSCVGFDEL